MSDILGQIHFTKFNEKIISFNFVIRKRPTVDKTFLEHISPRKNLLRL